MASNMITTYTNFDASNVTFSELRKNKMGGKVVYLSGPGRKKIQLELPKMRAPFGVSEFVDQNTGKSSWSLNLSLEGHDDLREKFEKLDKMIVKTVAQNSKKWLGKQHSEAVLRDALYSPVVKQPMDDKYSPTIKLKILADENNNFKPETYNMKQELVDLKDLEKGQSMNTIIEIGQVWIIDNKFGVSLRLSQGLIHPTDKLSGFAFQTVDTKKDDSESETEEADDEVEYEEVEETEETEEIEVDE